MFLISFVSLLALVACAYAYGQKRYVLSSRSCQVVLRKLSEDFNVLRQAEVPVVLHRTNLCNFWTKGYNVCLIHECGETLTGQRGQFRTPTEDDEYLPNAFCRWSITVPAGCKVKLWFTLFEIEHNVLCKYDSVTIYETYVSSTSYTNKLGKWCGTNMPQPMTSSGNTMVVVFESDSSVPARGFEAKYEAVNCGGAGVTERATTLRPTTSRIANRRNAASGGFRLTFDRVFTFFIFSCFLRFLG